MALRARTGLRKTRMERLAAGRRARAAQPAAGGTPRRARVGQRRGLGAQRARATREPKSFCILGSVHAPAAPTVEGETTRELTGLTDRCSSCCSETDMEQDTGQSRGLRDGEGKGPDAHRRAPRCRSLASGSSSRSRSMHLLQNEVLDPLAGACKRNRAETICTNQQLAVRAAHTQPSI